MSAFGSLAPDELRALQRHFGLDVGEDPPAPDRTALWDRVGSELESREAAGLGFELDPITRLPKIEPFNPADNLSKIFGLSEEFFSNIMRDPQYLAQYGWQRGQTWRDTNLENWEPFLRAIEDPRAQEFMRGIAGRVATGVSMPGLIAEPSFGEWGIVGGELARAAGWLASNADTVAKAASLFPFARMVHNAPEASGWLRAFRNVSKGGPPHASHFLQEMAENVQGARLIDDDFIRLNSHGGQIEIFPVAADPKAIELYFEGAMDLSSGAQVDLARIMELADSADIRIITAPTGLPYDFARNLGFVEESLGGRLVREPVSVAPDWWYSEMYGRLAPDDPTDLRMRAGLKEGRIHDELTAAVAESNLPTSEKDFWFNVIADAETPDAFTRVINDLTDRGVIGKIPGEDFIPRPLDGPPRPPPRSLDDVIPAGGIPDDLANKAANLSRAHQDAIARGGPFTVDEWRRFLDIEGVRMPTGDPNNPLRSLTDDEVMSLYAQMIDPTNNMPVNLESTHIAQIVSSEFVTPVTPQQIRDADRVLLGLQDTMDLQQRSIINILNTALESGQSLPRHTAGNFIEGIFPVRPEDLGRGGDVLIDWLDGIQRTWVRYGKTRQYNVQEVVNRGLADLKVVANTPNVGGNVVQDYDLLIAVRQMGRSADGGTRNLFEVVNDLHQIYPNVPLEQLQSIAEMALL